MVQPVTLIVYPPCTTCQKARAWLLEQGIEFTERHIKEQRPTAEELRRWSREAGLPLKRYFNTSGLLYRSMRLSERLPGLDEEEQARPARVGRMLGPTSASARRGPALPGFRPAEWDALLRETVQSI